MLVLLRDVQTMMACDFTRRRLRNCCPAWPGRAGPGCIATGSTLADTEQGIRDDDEHRTVGNSLASDASHYHQQADHQQNFRRAIEAGQ
jgi:hypothetical protein